MFSGRGTLVQEMENVQTVDDRLLQRFCVNCGYDGTLLRNGAADECARCGCDLRERPARSYAEMEGLVGQPVTLDSPTHRNWREEQFIQRWLVFLFVVMVGFITLLYLASAATTPQAP